MNHPIPPDYLAAIPIAVFMIIDAVTASSSPLQRTMKIVRGHAGIHVQVRLEPAFTMRAAPTLSAAVAMPYTHPIAGADPFTERSAIENHQITIFVDVP